MKTRYAITALLLSACGDASGGESPGGREVVDFTPIEPLPTLVTGPVFELTGLRFSGPLITLGGSRHPWVVPVAAGSLPAFATSADRTIDLLAQSGGTHERVGLMPIARDGTPGVPIVIAQRGQRLEVTRCGDALWMTRGGETWPQITRLTIDDVDADWSFGASESIDFMADLAAGDLTIQPRPVCLPTGRVVFTVRATTPVTVSVAGTAVGTIGSDHDKPLHLIDVASVLTHGTLDDVVATDALVRGVLPGRGDSMLIFQAEVIGDEPSGNPIFEYALVRWDYTTETETLVPETDPDALGPLAESAAGTRIRCGHPLLDESAPVDTDLHCAGYIEGQLQWQLTLADTLLKDGVMLDGMLWLSTVALVTNAADGAEAGVGTLIAIEPDEGVIVDRVAFALGASTTVTSMPRRMVGEGRCAGIVGVGALFASGDSSGLIRYDRVFGAGGATCSEPVAYLTGIAHQGLYLYDDYQLAEPVAGPCADNPHLMLSSGRSGSGEKHRLWATRAADCTIGNAPQTLRGTMP